VPLRSGAHLWLPFTQMGAFDAQTRTFVRGDGNYLIDARGNRVFDAVSSIWTTVHGHCHPAILHAVSRQAATLDHSTLLGATNPPAEELAAELADLLRLDYTFFASDGASAIEAALKMALQYWQNAGEPQRTRFVRLTGSYHGDTAGAMSVSDIELFKSRFGSITFETHAYDCHDEILRSRDVAAIVVEPLVQAASGMRLVPAEKYSALRDRTPLLIVDEIATGFGRTGTMFASECLDLAPDIVCVGKGLTGGTLALSATVVTERVYAAFLGAQSGMRHFFHGHSYAGNPIACAAALANIALFRTEDTLARAQSCARAVSPLLNELRTHPNVRDVRQCGLMIGVEIAPERIPPNGFASPAWRIAAGLYDRGHFTRPIGDVVQLVPPLSSTIDELRAFVGDLYELLA